MTFNNATMDHSERAIVLLEGMVGEYNTYMDQMFNEADSAKSEYDDEGFHETQMQTSCWFVVHVWVLWFNSDVWFDVLHQISFLKTHVLVNPFLTYIILTSVPPTP